MKISETSDIAEKVTFLVEENKRLTRKVAFLFEENERLTRNVTLLFAENNRLPRTIKWLTSTMKWVLVILALIAPSSILGTAEWVFETRP